MSGCCIDVRAVCGLHRQFHHFTYVSRGEGATRHQAGDGDGLSVRYGNAGGAHVTPCKGGFVLRDAAVGREGVGGRQRLARFQLIGQRQVADFWTN